MEIHQKRTPGRAEHGGAITWSFGRGTRSFRDIASKYFKDLDIFFQHVVTAVTTGHETSEFQALGPDLCKQFVGVQLEAFCEDWGSKDLLCQPSFFFELGYHLATWNSLEHPWKWTAQLEIWRTPENMP